MICMQFQIIWAHFTEGITQRIVEIRLMGNGMNSTTHRLVQQIEKG